MLGGTLECAHENTDNIIITITITITIMVLIILLMKADITWDNLYYFVLPLTAALCKTRCCVYGVPSTTHHFITPRVNLLQPSALT